MGSFKPQSNGPLYSSTVMGIHWPLMCGLLHLVQRRPLHVAYVDLKSAFDSVDRQALWKALQGVGVPDIRGENRLFKTISIFALQFQID